MSTKRLQRIMLQILLVWCTLFLVLAITTVQGLDWSPQLPAPAPVLVVQESPAPAPVPIPEAAPPTPAFQLLAQGKKAGHGSLGTPVIAWDKNRAEVTVTVPWSGSLGEYSAFHFDKVQASVFDLHGQWQMKADNMTVRDKSCPIRLVQTGQHGTFVRFSLVGACTGVQEVRYTTDSLILVLGSVQQTRSRH